MCQLYIYIYIFKEEEKKTPTYMNNKPEYFKHGKFPKTNSNDSRESISFPACILY